MTGFQILRVWKRKLDMDNEVHAKEKDRQRGVGKVLDTILTDYEKG